MAVRSKWASHPDCTPRAMRLRTLPMQPARRSRLGFRAFLAPVIAMGIAAPGCTPGDREINAFINAWEASVSASDYRVQPPDVISISSPNAPEVDGESQTIRQDGKVTLRLIGEVKVAGMTPVEIGRKLESLLGKYYVDPAVSVNVKGRGSKRFYVFGEVGGPGPFRYTGRDTLLQVLAAARPTFLAWRSQIKVIRPSHEEEKRRVMTVDADRMMREGKLDQNILLQEGDIVYVPPTPLAWVALRLRELLWPFEESAEQISGPEEAGRTVQSGMDWLVGR